MVPTDTSRTVPSKERQTETSLGSVGTPKSSPPERTCHGLVECFCSLDPVDDFQAEQGQLPNNISFFPKISSPILNSHILSIVIFYNSCLFCSFCSKGPRPLTRTCLDLSSVRRSPSSKGSAVGRKGLSPADIGVSPRHRL